MFVLKTGLVVLLMSCEVAVTTAGSCNSFSGGQCKSTPGCSWSRGKCSGSFVAPTPAPVPKPTPAPVPAPSQAPVPAPVQPTPSGNDDDAACSSGIKVTEQTENPALPSGTLSVKSYGGTSVTFTVEQRWKSGGSISWIAPVYRQNGNDYVCKEDDKREGVSFGTTASYTAECVNGVADVIIYVHDGQFKGKTSERNVHNCNGWGTENGIAKYAFEVPCQQGQSVCGPALNTSPVPAPIAPVPNPTPAPVPAPVPASLPACSTYNGGQCPTDRCTRNGGSCSDPQGGSGASAPVPVPAGPTPCSQRSGNSCEDGDGMCMKVKGSCQEVNAGSGSQNDACQAMLTTDSEGDYIYVEIPGKGCAAGYTCDVAKSASAALLETPLDGVCESEGCIGKKVPGNCNGNNPNNAECNAKTERVTICHRTCSATNPWVRITIDEDAWDGEGCGHQQHDIRDECANKAPWTEWGVNRKDYLIKRHGTRDEVAARLGNKAAEKAYWKQWERACPFVRNGACCDWNDPENPCCGDAPGSSSAEAPVPNPTPAPVAAPLPVAEPRADGPGECPYVTLDFNNLANPMAEYYDQSPIFQAGDYLYDQLWLSHGVKVSARVRANGHRTSSDPFIPKYDREQQKWVDAKSSQSANDPTSGGAIRLFDTLRPTYSNNPAYHQPLCGKQSSEGDPDLGSPNNQCEGGGPGVGPGGIPFDPETNQVNPYANCEPLGLIGIIQETDKPCPDDTARGGFITFEFREPISHLHLASLLDIDEGSSTPKIHVTYLNGAKTETFNTFPTGDNGLFPLYFDNTYEDITMIDIEYWGSGSINSLVYRYCPETPVPRIDLKKYAGPPGKCSSQGLSQLKDDTYEVPSMGDEWTYCYKVTVPNDSEECLFDVVLDDSAPIGGTKGSSISITEPMGLMCPGDTVFVEGAAQPGSNAPEGMINAVVRGIGQYSSQEAVADDPAAVEIFDCPIDMGSQSDSACPGSDIEVVSILDIKSTQGRIIPEGYDISSIFYQMEFVGTSQAPEVQFKIDSPFEFDTDMYLQYHVSVGSKGGLGPDCEARMDEPGCHPESSLIRAGCVKPLDDNHLPYAIVSVFFVSENSIFGTGASGDVTPYECCPIPDADKNKPIIEYTFKVLCSCPPIQRISSRVRSTSGEVAPSPGLGDRTSDRGSIQRTSIRVSG